VNRVHKLLQEANIKLGNVLADVRGVSGKAILAALARGETDPEHVSSRAHTSEQRKHEQLVQPFEDCLGRFEQITGVSLEVLYVVFAEVGTVMSRFPDAAHLVSWAGMCPDHQESAGKLRSGRLR
jgi:transposase